VLSFSRDPVSLAIREWSLRRAALKSFRLDVRLRLYQKSRSVDAALDLRRNLANPPLPDSRIIFIESDTSGAAPKAVGHVVQEIKFRRVPMKKLFVILFVEPGFGWMAITIFGSVYVLYAQTGFWLN